MVWILQEFKGTQLIGLIVLATADKAADGGGDW